MESTYGPARHSKLLINYYYGRFCSRETTVMQTATRESVSDTVRHSIRSSKHLSITKLEDSISEGANATYLIYIRGVNLPFFIHKYLYL